jgi:hypothetical protein
MSYDPIPKDYPTRWEVCYQCQGSGASSAYLGAFTGDEWYELDQDFRDDYMSGCYDQECDVCNGRTTVRVIDEDRLTDTQRKELDSLARCYQQCYQQEANERRQGA